MRKYYDWDDHTWLVDLTDAQRARKLGHTIDEYTEEQYKNRFEHR